MSTQTQEAAPVAAQPLVPQTVAHGVIGARIVYALYPLEKLEKIIDGADALLRPNGSDVDAVPERDAHALTMLLQSIQGEIDRVHDNVLKLAGVLGGAKYACTDLPELDADERETIARVIAEYSKPAPSKPVAATPFSERAKAKLRIRTRRTRKGGVA